MNLWSDFPIQTSNDWEKKLENDLKNNDPNSLTWKHSIGDINPLINYNPNSDFHLSPSKLKSLSWKIDHSNFTNSFVLSTLSFGINSLIFDNILLDETKLKNVMHNIIFQHVLINHTSSKETISSWLKWIKSNYLENKGSFRFDPIQIALNNHPQQTELTNQLDNWKNLISDLSETNYSCIYVDGAVYGNALANTEDEVAYILAHTNEYIEQMKNNNQTCPNKLIVRVTVSPKYLIELGKIRALRFLLKKVIEHHELSIKIEIECVNNYAFFNPIDKESNLMRFTTSYMTAMNAGCDSIEITDYLDNIDNDKYSKNISTNIALILKEESHLGKVSDPAKGSYYIESITKNIIEKSLDIFLLIEKNGGWIKYLENEEAQDKCEQNKRNIIQSMLKNETNIIGFNKYSDAQLDFNKNVDLKGFNPFNLNMFA
jgi:methylmalonyl-CoA mutase